VETLREPKALRHGQMADGTPNVVAEPLAWMEEVHAGSMQVHDSGIVATMHLLGFSQPMPANAGGFGRFAYLITVLPLEAVS
jgi:hypothetical protein